MNLIHVTAAFCFADGVCERGVKRIMEITWREMDQKRG